MSYSRLFHIRRIKTNHRDIIQSTEIGVMEILLVDKLEKVLVSLAFDSDTDA